MKTIAQKIVATFFALSFFLLLPIQHPEAHGASFFEQFIDPIDGKFDTSNWLIHKKGFLPVPIIVTEPAVGYGGGAALLFFHAKKDAQSIEKIDQKLKDNKERNKPSLPPSISGLVGLGTENDTWAAGGFHFGSWQKDKIRYTGGIVYPSVNLTFYGGSGSSNPMLDKGLDYNLEGWFLFQEMVFRIKETNYFLGPRFIYYNADSKFDLPFDGIPSWQFNLKSYGIGLEAAYDSRNNIFTPNRGIRADISSLFFNVKSEIGGSRDYWMTDASGKFYRPIFSDIILGWRLHGSFGSGDIPFYALPFIDLRGIPVMRYQGENVLVTELETRWNVNERWSLIFFGGVGATADSTGDFSNSDKKWAGGGGFRYLMARLLGMYTGIDIARGPEDWAFYIQVGSAWH